MADLPNKDTTNVNTMDIYFDIEGVRYAALDAIPVQFQPHSLVTVITCDVDGLVNASWLKEKLFDVYRPDLFMKSLVVTNTTEESLTSDFCDYLKALGTEWFVNGDKTLALPPGPYMYFAKALRPVSRLYDDTHGTLLTALKPKMAASGEDNIPFLQLKAGGTSYACLAVAVPPRSSKRLRPSLCGLRVVVKDIYHVRGLKNSLCNRAYYDWSNKSASTAGVVQTLRNGGAHILGITKLSSMIAREEPMDAVDFLSSFNPRGDGYQSPAGSSSGSAAAVASYDWLDCSIGSDTTGSGRRPALVNGVWQFRPSHDLVDLEGMIPTFLRFDTPCVFARDLGVIEPVLRGWVEDSKLAGPTSLPYEIIYLHDYLPVENAEQMRLIDGFVNDMSAHLSAAVTKLSIRDMWKADHPAGTPEDVDEYMKDVITRTFYYGFYHSTDDFRNSYPESHGGRPPYMIPFVQRRQAKGAAVTEVEHEEAMERVEVYKDWLLETLFRRRGTEALIVLPIANVKPNYRDMPSPSPEHQSALDELFVSPILKAPDIMVPIGEVPYDSRISGKVEYLPVLVNVVGAPKTDLSLLQAVEKVMALSNDPLSSLQGLECCLKGNNTSTVQGHYVNLDQGEERPADLLRRWNVGSLSRTLNPKHLHPALPVDFFVQRIVV